MTTAQRHDSMLKFILIIFHITLLVEGLDFPPYENIALHKAANLSSVNEYYPNMTAQTACDGNRNNRASMEENSCIHTKYLQHEEEAWWTVDLSFITHVHEIYITNRKWEADGKNSSERLAGFSIYVSNTSHFTAGEICFKQDGNLPSVDTTMYRCVATGRFVTVYNDRSNHSQYPAYYSASAVLELCEVEVPGCKKKFFGADCSKNCFCKDVTCDYVSGICDGECESGYTGISCNETCPAGSFGDNCSQSCPHCDGDKTCNNTGNCTYGCEEGYFTDYHSLGCPNKCGKCEGARCEEGGKCPGPCVSGFHSINCTLPCPKTCFDKQCVQTNGTCTKCKAGHFGNFCEKNCSANCERNTCGFETGHCQDCESGWYGDKCGMECKHCGGNKACYHNGTCVGECESGYTKDETGECVSICNECNEDCKYGWYGVNCELECKHCGSNKTCHRNGTCVGECETGYTKDQAGGCLSTCSDCDEEATKGPAESQAPYAAIGAGGGGLVLLVIIVVIAILYRRKRNKGKSPQVQYRSEGTEFKDHIYTNTQVGNKDSCVSLNEENADINDQRQGSSSSTGNSVLGKPETVIYNNVGDETDGIEVDTFQNYVRMKYREKELENEYKDIPYGAIYPHDEAKKTLNIPRNRFKAIFPYDHSRVILDSQGQKSDYINASYIDDTKDPQKYIATQGPLTNTIADFWRMAWEKKVDKIVMLTNLKEVNKTKCEKYWPDPNKPERHDIYEISCMDERLFSYYVVRNLRIQHKKSKEQRHVWHFHFTTWPDHGTPDPLLLVLFHKRVVNANGTSNGPVIVHCSAGVGRTGTYIGLDALVKQGRETGQVNVKNYVEKMRKDRMNMVQTDQQYIVLHEALAEALELHETMIPMDKFPSEWRKSLKDPRPTNQKKLKQEYDSLRSLKKPHDPHDCKTAISNANRKKNRNDSIVAPDKYRPYLSPAGHGRTDYINAIILPTHTKRNGYIVTQRPMEDTVLDFWQLVEEHEISNIVLFEKDSDEKTEFYPSTDVMEIENAIVQKRGETNILNSIVQIELLIVYNDVNEDRLIRLYKVDMKKNQLPTAMQVLKTNESLLSLGRAQADGPLLVVSQEGTTPCDVYCTVTNIQESMKIDNEIDIFQTARQLQLRRPEFFGSYRIYELCFEIINEHLTSDSLYFNM